MYIYIYTANGIFYTFPSIYRLMESNRAIVGKRQVSRKKRIRRIKKRKKINETNATNARNDSLEPIGGR